MSTTEALKALSSLIVARRATELAEGGLTDEAFDSAIDQDEAELNEMGRMCATQIAGIQAKARALLCSSFVLYQMVDSPTNGEAGVLLSLLREVVAL